MVSSVVHAFVATELSKLERESSKLVGIVAGAGRPDEIFAPAATTAFPVKDAPLKQKNAPKQHLSDRCLPYCLTHSASWSVKCGWKKGCLGCDECKDAPLKQKNATKHHLSDRCEPHCLNDSASWIVKCGWKKVCLGCDECKESNGFCVEPTVEHPLPSKPKRIAMVVSGLDTRFTYADSATSRTAFEDIDVFVMLQRGEATDKGSFLLPHPIRPPYNQTVESIETWYHERGASYVDVTIVTTAALDARVHVNVKKPPFRDQTRWQRNTRMLGLRRMGYERLRDVGSGYDFILYVREDNVFLEDSFQVKQLQRLCNQDEACYVVDKFCQWHGFSDKMYWLNLAAAEIMFAPMTSRNVETLWKRQGDTEYWISLQMERGGVCAQKWDFRRTELRYVANQDGPCVEKLYYRCNSGQPYPQCNGSVASWRWQIHNRIQSHNQSRSRNHHHHLNQNRSHHLNQNRSHLPNLNQRLRWQYFYMD